MINEFRQDLVSGEWVLLATGRAKRPVQFDDSKKAAIQDKKTCPFEDPEGSGNEVLSTYEDNGRWSVKVLKNKFPAILEGNAVSAKQAGPFGIIEGRGRHEVVVFRDHDKSFSQFSAADIASAMKVYQDRYLSMLDHGSTKYILIFHNHGLKAGASIAHPHSQIISVPIMPPDVRRSIEGSERFYKEKGQRIYDVMLEWELKENKRIVYENDNFLALCPFVSKTPYEMRIFPKESHAHFEQMPSTLLPDLGDITSTVLKKMDAALDNPDFNFFIHTSPIESPVDPHEFYTWHVEIVPVISTIGAFELGSGMDINTVDPDEAAKLLRDI